MMDASQIIMLHTLNWYSAVCQLYLEGEKENNSFLKICAFYSLQIISQ